MSLLQLFTLNGGSTWMWRSWMWGSLGLFIFADFTLSHDDVTKNRPDFWSTNIDQNQFSDLACLGKTLVECVGVRSTTQSSQSPFSKLLDDAVSLPLKFQNYFSCFSFFPPFLVFVSPFLAPPFFWPLPSAGSWIRTSHRIKKSQFVNMVVKYKMPCVRAYSHLLLLAA